MLKAKWTQTTGPRELHSLGAFSKCVLVQTRETCATLTDIVNFIGHGSCHVARDEGLSLHSLPKTVQTLCRLGHDPFSAALHPKGLFGDATGS